MRTCLLFACAGLLITGGAGAQPFTNASLSGKHHFVELQVTTWMGAVVDARNLGGAITFSGDGTYSFTGKLGVGSGAPAASSGSGTYSVSGPGSVTMSDPIQSTVQLNARINAEGVLVLGASTEATENTCNIFVAVKAPTAGVTNAVLNGAYTGATVQFPSGSSAAMKSAVMSLAANGRGQFTRVGITGHANDGGGRNVTQEITNATYDIGSDGTGSASFGSTAALFSGARDLFVSQDGNFVLGVPAASGGRDIFIATKNFSATASASSLNGRYWIAELTATQPGWLSPQFSFSCASGALNAFGDGRVALSQRLLLDTRPLDFTGVNSYSVSADGTGLLAPQVTQGGSNMALGVAAMVGGTPRPGTLVGAQVGAVGATTGEYGIFFAVRAPTFASSGLFLDPNGIVNGASFAPTPNPVAPGMMASLFGANLAPREGRATSLPLPATLEGVSVTVNDVAAPLFYVSAGQVNFQVPFGLTGNTARVVLANSVARTTGVTVLLASTSPGILSYADAVSPNRGIIVHGDYSLVTPQNPARPGETVVIYLTGLGELRPAVATGAGHPVSPLASAVDRWIQAVFGGEAATSAPFVGGAPFFAGLNQINVVIPSTVSSGDIPVAIATRNAFADLVDIAIRF